VDWGKASILIYMKGDENIKRKAAEGIILIDAADYNDGNLVYHPEFSMMLDGGVSPAYAAYRITFPQKGVYELWIKYATMDKRPVDVYLDEKLVKSNAMSYLTSGWALQYSEWFREAQITVTPGGHFLKLIADKNLFPHISEIKFIYKKKG